MNILIRCKRQIIRLRRLPRTKGFGVQSPTDYRFVTQVLRQTVPPAARTLLPSRGEEYSFCRLAYLLAAAQQPSLFVNLTMWTALDNAIFVAHNGSYSGTADDLPRATLVAVDAAALCTDTAQGTLLLNSMAADSSLIVRNIRRDTACRRAWQALLQHPRAIITYDLYDFGIVQTYTKRYRQHYNINF